MYNNIFKDTSITIKLSYSTVTILKIRGMQIVTIVLMSANILGHFPSHQHCLVSLIRDLQKFPTSSGCYCTHICN